MPRMSFFDEFVGFIPNSSDLAGAISCFGSYQTDSGATFRLSNAISGVSAGRVRTVGTTGKHAGLYLEFPKAQARRNPVYGGTMIFNDPTIAITQQKVWFGFSETKPATTSLSDEFYGFFLDTGTSEGANWQCVYRPGDGSTNDLFDTGFTGKKKFWYAFEITFTPTDVLYGLNGKLVQRIKRTVPASNLYWVVAAETKENAAKEMMFDFLYGSQDR